jgi:WhiB family redox-sensing transcriptional regulator
VPRTDFIACFAQPPWSGDALCREYPGFKWVSPKASARARAICQRCLVRDECLAVGLSDPDLTGVWGGTSDQERRRIRASR